MARIEWVRQRLENWARWCALQDGSALGYPTQSAFARLGGRGSRAEATVPIASIAAAETDEAVKSLQLTRSHLYLVLTLHYAKGFPIDQVARKMGRSIRAVQQNLCDADAALARWHDDRQRLRQQQRVSAIPSPQSGHGNEF